MSGERILVVDDEADIRAMVREILDDEGYEVDVAANASEARTARQAHSPDLVLLDIWMPDTDGITLLREWSEAGDLDAPVVMLSGHGTVDTAIEATRLGAADFLEKPLSLAKLLDTIEQALTQHSAANKAGRHALIPERLEPLGKSPVVENFREQLQRAAQHDAPVLLAGEPGTGRGSSARYLHAISTRAAEPFIDVVPAALGANPVAALLGERDDGEVKAGLIARARAGVLFIDELRDLDDDTQSLLAGVLESGRYRPVGAEREERLTCRIIASTRPGFREAAEAGRLRRDLIDAVGALTIQAPALRQYHEDVPELLRYYVDLLVDQEDLRFRRVSFAAQNRLRNYPWPGNLRELRNLVRQFLTLGGSGEVSLSEVEEALAATVDDEQPLVKQDLLSLPLREAREHFERAYLEQQLKLSGGRVGKLAERVGMERTHLYRKLRSLGIELHSSDD
ncbi:MAG TPA: sigma-54 dependent transcriptional regulator [Gammaproteobacteria bacterium]|nr:sigma-54 dependent transcriptional regulator [Gammaproteobacteria bacterium]HET7587339.1 sigma-54 dependent transcriptional regulator [Gammaproteobacteria bacterium]